MLALEAIELGKKYGDIWGLKNSTFSVNRGELAVLVGPNGAGKTTTVRLLATILKPTKGKASVLGMDLVSEYKEIRKKIAYLPQDFGPYRDLTPMEAVMWSLVARGWPLTDARTQAKYWIELMGLWDSRNKTCWTLSGGQRRRVVVAMVLATEADLIFLDEPTTGLDVEARHSAWKAIREIVKEGTTILLTTHNMEEAETIADTVILINQGKTLVQGSPSRLVDSLPYKHRIVAKKADKMDVDLKNFIDLGDRLIAYARDYEEAKDLVSKLSDFTSVLSIDRVGLEDAYLYLVNRGRENYEKA